MRPAPLLRPLAVGGVLLLSVTRPASAFQSARPAGAPTATSTERFESIGAVIDMPDGRVAVNDLVARRLVLLTPTLAPSRVLLDSARVGEKARYGDGGAALLPWGGDTLLFADLGSSAMVLIGSDGTQYRTFAAPRKLPSLFPGFSGYPVVDAQHRVTATGGLIVTRPNPRDAKPGMFTFVADSVPLLRTDLVTGASDTLTYVAASGAKAMLNALPGGGVAIVPYIRSPRPKDAWAARADGSVLIVRGRTLRTTVLAPNGSKTEQPRIPYPWERLSDSAKIALVDAEVAKAVEGPEGQRSTQRGVEFAYVREPVEEVMDYYPAFTDQGALADPANRTWLRLTATAEGGAPIYMVLGPDGSLAEYAFLPPNSAVAGFARDGSLFLGERDASGLRLTKWSVAALRRSKTLK